MCTPNITEDATRILRAAARHFEPSDVGIPDLEEEKGRPGSFTYASRDHGPVFV